MKIDNQPIIEEEPTITARLSHFSVVARQPVPVDESNYFVFLPFFIVDFR